MAVGPRTIAVIALALLFAAADAAGSDLAHHAHAHVKYQLPAGVRVRALVFYGP
jgi:hypothetical protein